MDPPPRCYFQTGVIKRHRTNPRSLSWPRLYAIPAFTPTAAFIKRIICVTRNDVPTGTILFDSDLEGKWEFTIESERYVQNGYIGYLLSGQTPKDVARKPVPTGPNPVCEVEVRGSLRGQLVVVPFLLHLCAPDTEVDDNPKRPREEAQPAPPPVPLNTPLTRAQNSAAFQIPPEACLQLRQTADEAVRKYFEQRPQEACYRLRESLTYACKGCFTLVYSDPTKNAIVSRLIRPANDGLHICDEKGDDFPEPRVAQTWPQLLAVLGVPDAVVARIQYAGEDPLGAKPLEAPPADRVQPVPPVPAQPPAQSSDLVDGLPELPPEFRLPLSASDDSSFLHMLTYHSRPPIT